MIVIILGLDKLDIHLPVKLVPITDDVEFISNPSGLRCTWVSSNNKTNRNNIAEMLLKVVIHHWALDTESIINSVR